MRSFTLFTLAVLSISMLLAGAINFNNAVITEATKSVDLNTQLVYDDTFLTFKNVDNRALNELYFAVEEKLLSRVALITVEDPEIGSLYRHELVSDSESSKKHNATVYKILVPGGLEIGGSVKIKVSTTYYKRMEPLPKMITTLEEQWMVYEDSSVVFSPYKVVSQKCEYKLAGPVKSEIGGGRVSPNKVEYEETAEAQPFTLKPTRIHFENNFPFAVFNEVVKTIQISHWGNIYIVEEYKLENQGAEHTGEFNRIDANNLQNGKYAVRSLHANYPPNIWGLHYRDEIGNISSSNAFRESHRVSLDIKPRFPVFGGWKAWWDLSYNLPTKEYLFQDKLDDTKLMLKQTFGYPFPSIIAEDYTLRIIFPEGTKNANISLPFAVDSQHWEKTFDMLDFEGRPTLVVKKKNVVHYHHQEFKVTYQFDRASIMIEPVYLIVAYIALFAILIVYGRLDFEFRRKSALGEKVKHE